VYFKNRKTMYKLISAIYFIIFGINYSYSQTINAGIDQDICISSTNPIYLTGTSPLSLSEIKWTQVLGLSISITNSSSSVTTITGLSAGVYKFSFSGLSSSGALVSDTVEIRVWSVPTVITLADTVSCGQIKLIYPESIANAHVGKWSLGSNISDFILDLLPTSNQRIANVKFHNFSEGCEINFKYTISNPACSAFTSRKVKFYGLSVTNILATTETIYTNQFKIVKAPIVGCVPSRIWSSWSSNPNPNNTVQITPDGSVTNHSPSYTFPESGIYTLTGKLTAFQLPAPYNAITCPEINFTQKVIPNIFVDGTGTPLIQPIMVSGNLRKCSIGSSYNFVYTLPTGWSVCFSTVNTNCGITNDFFPAFGPTLPQPNQPGNFQTLVTFSNLFRNNTQGQIQKLYIIFTHSNYPNSPVIYDRSIEYPGDTVSNFNQTTQNIYCPNSFNILSYLQPWTFKYGKTIKVLTSPEPSSGQYSTGTIFKINKTIPSFITPLKSGTYKFEIKVDVPGCGDRIDTISFKVIDLPEIYAGPDAIIPCNQRIQLSGSNPSAININLDIIMNWRQIDLNPPVIINNPNSYNPKINQMIKGKTYFFEYSYSLDNGSCIKKDTIKIEYLECCTKATNLNCYKDPITSKYMLSWDKGSNADNQYCVYHGSLILNPEVFSCDASVGPFIMFGSNSCLNVVPGLTQKFEIPENYYNNIYKWYVKTICQLSGSESVISDTVCFNCHYEVNKDKSTGTNNILSINQVYGEKNNLKIAITSAKDFHTKINLIDITGRVVFSQLIEIKQGLNNYSLGNNYSSGVYFLTTEIEGQVINKKLNCI
jgi:hypothetical protein